MLTVTEIRCADGQYRVETRLDNKPWFTVLRPIHNTGDWDKAHMAVDITLVTQPLVLKHTDINTGGLYRCCIRSLQHYVNQGPDKPGYPQTFICPICKDKVALERRSWRWFGSA